MNLGVNLFFLELGRVGGSETFAREILKKIDIDFATKNKVFLYCTESFLATQNYKNIITRPYLKNASNRLWRLFFEIFIFPFILIKDKIRVLHSMGHTFPIITPCKKIVTIFDTQFKSVPRTVTSINRLIYSLLMPLIVRVNDLIITTSD